MGMDPLNGIVKTFALFSRLSALFQNESLSQRQSENKLALLLPSLKARPLGTSVDFRAPPDECPQTGRRSAGV